LELQRTGALSVFTQLQGGTETDSRGSAPKRPTWIPEMEDEIRAQAVDVFAVGK